MEEIVKLLDKNSEYVKHEVSENRITIWVKSAKKSNLSILWEPIQKSTFKV